jgi:CBS domain-containing protein
MRHAGSGDTSGGTLCGGRPVGTGRRGRPWGSDGDALFVREVMSRDLVVLAAWLPLSGLAERAARPRHATYAVVDGGGRPVGTLDLSALGDDLFFDGRTVRDVCTPIEASTLLHPDEPFDAACPHGPLALVVEAGRLVGVVSAGSIARFERRRSLLPDALRRRQAQTLAHVLAS